MNKTIYKIHEITVKDYNRGENKIVFNVKFSKNEMVNEFTESFEPANSASVVNAILLKLKSMDKIIVESDSDDFLDNIYITRIFNEDLIEEKMLMFFSKLFEKVRALKHERVAGRYLNTIDDIKHQKLVL